MLVKFSLQHSRAASHEKNFFLNRQGALKSEKKEETEEERHLLGGYIFLKRESMNDTLVFSSKHTFQNAM